MFLATLLQKRKTPAADHHWRGQAQPAAEHPEVTSDHHDDEQMKGKG